MKLSEICKFVGAEFDGREFEVTALNSLGRASSSELSYCDSVKNAKFIAESKAGAILVTKDAAHLVKSEAVAVVVENPHLAFALLSKPFSNPLFYEKKPSFVDESATVMPNVYIGNGVKVGARSVVMAGAFLGDNVSVGDDCVIHPNAVLYNNTKVGDRCVLNANCVLGSDGFGFAHTKNGEHVKIYHNGWVELEDDVEVGACTTIDRGVFEPTVVRKFSKIDNLVQVGHNCEVGFGCLLVSQVGLAGSTKLGRNVVMGGQSGSGGHVSVGDFAQIAGRGGVSKDLEGGKSYGGHPIMELKEWMKFHAKLLREFGVKR